MLGIRNAFRVGTAIPVTNVTPLTSGLTFPIAANQIARFRAYLTFSIGAAGGVRFNVTVPAAGTTFNATYRFYNNVAPGIVSLVQIVSGTPFTDAAANAGNHNLELECDIANGATAGSVDLVFAQNTNNATPITLFIGSYMDVIYL